MSGTSRFIRKLKKPLFKKRMPASTTAKRALRIARRAQNELQTQSNANTQLLNVAPTITQLLITGDPNTQDLDYTFLKLDMEVRQDLASAVIDSYRIMVILDKNPNNALLTAIDVFEDVTPGITHYPDLKNKKRFTYLYDVRGSFEENNNVSKQIRIRRKLRFTSRGSSRSSQVATSLVSNALYLFVYTTSTANQPTIIFSSEISAVQ